MWLKFSTELALNVYIIRKMKELHNPERDVKEDDKLTTARALLRKSGSTPSAGSTSMPEPGWTITDTERSVIDKGRFSSHRLREIVDTLHPHPEPPCSSMNEPTLRTFNIACLFSYLACCRPDESNTNNI